MFSYLSPEERVPVTRPLRPIRHYVDAALIALSPQLATLYAQTGRPRIAPEKLLRTLLLQMRYSFCSEWLLIEECSITCGSAGLPASIWMRRGVVRE